MPALSLLGIYFKKYTHLYVHSSIIHNSQDMETASMSVGRWMDEDVLHVYNGILLNYKKEWNNPIWRNMDATRDYHSKWSKSERKKQIPYDITYRWNLKYGTNEQKQDQKHRE